VAPPPPPPTSRGVVGFPGAVDAVATLDVARDLVVRERLGGIVLEGVRSDGTVDLSKTGARVRYVFQSGRGEGIQPPRPKGTLPTRAYCGRQDVNLTQEGLAADADNPSVSCTPGAEEELPDPRCGPREVWAQAKKRGAPEGGTARIEYYRAKAGPAWRFELPGGRQKFSVYGDCERELRGKDAAGTVP
jgi:hypothetical protein